MSENNEVQTTGHVWDDDLAELTNPLPEWWRILFHISWIWCIVYALIYPMFPMVETHTKGMTGWTAIGEYKEGLDELKNWRNKKFATQEAQLEKLSVGEILADRKLTNYAKATARVMFGDKCAACHGSAGQGLTGFPILVDDDWLYGGTGDNIVATITTGRKGVMPAMGGMPMTDAEIDSLAQAIMNGDPTADPSYMAKGCVGCHAPNGKGMHPLGSPNLTDKIWRFAGEDQAAEVRKTIKHGVNDANDAATRKPEMPGFAGKLSEKDIKRLAVFVHSLGGGQ